MTTVLVANRAEIARRISRTVRRLGMRAVAVYSDADAGLPFVREADAAIRIGPAPARESYLAIDRIIEAAREAEADLVHPGYGFLAESPDFANAVSAAGLRFVGPPAAVLAALGDKAEAKAIAERAGVPVLPGYRGAEQTDAAFAKGAREIGYPLMIKPLAGGGGIGMQAVRDERDLADALARARRIAVSAFGDRRLLLERLVDRPRHVEVQILADGHGNVRSIGDRDCSLQRRHQKVIERSPAPVGDDAHAALADAAVAIARRAGYANAGTVEFILDEDERFYFLEVNARLQVEHPATELVWGIDLVEQQLRVALGEQLPAPGKPRGASVEARLYAEDPTTGFLPSSGRLLHVRWPEGVRVDAGYEEGDLVTTHYDPLIAKLIAHGDNERIALRNLATALEDTEILGVRTNLAFLRALAVRAESGRLDTELVERELPTLVPPSEPAPEDAYALAGAATVWARRSPADPWTASGPWRIGEGPGTTVTLREGERERAIRISGSGPYRFADRRIGPAERHHGWTVEGAPPATAVVADGLVWVGLRGNTWELLTTPRERAAAETAGAEVTAPMPGMVIGAAAKPDSHVRRGELLFVVEAMKMELRVEAPADGRITRVLAKVGQQVGRGERLADFEPERA